MSGKDTLLAQESPTTAQADAALVEQWLAAGQAEDLSLDDRKYEAELVRLLPSLVSKDVQKAEALFLKACALIDEAAPRRGWEGSDAGNGWLTRSSLLAAVLKAAPRFEVLCFSLRLYETDTTGDLAHNGWWRTGRLGTPLLEEWLASGGTASTAAGCQGLLASLESQAGASPSALLGIAFYDFMSRLPFPWRQELLTWLARQEAPGKTDDSSPRVEEALRAAALLFCLTDNEMRSDPEVMALVEALGGSPAVWRHYREVMAEEARNPRTRTALGHHLCHVARHGVDAEVVRRAAVCALETQRVGGCINGYQLAEILRRFAELPLDDVWSAVAQGHYEAWTARCEKRVRVEASSLEYRPCDWALHNLLRLSARAQQDDWRDAIFKRHQHTLTNEPSALVELAAGNQSKAAVELLETHWRKILHESESYLRWELEVEAGLPAFRKASGEPGLALLGELLLADLPDPAPFEQRDFPGFRTRADRFLALAARFKETPFTDPALRERCLQVLAKVPVTLRVLHEEYREYAEGLDLQRLAKERDSTQARTALRPLAVWAGWQMAQGDGSGALEIYKTILDAPQEEHYSKRQLLKNLVTEAFGVLSWQWSVPETTSAPAEALLPFLEYVTGQTPENLADSQVGQAAALLLVAHHAAGHAPAANQWRKALPEAQAKLCAAKIQPGQVWQMIQILSGSKARRRLVGPARMDLVCAMLKEPWLEEKYRGTGAAPPNLVTDLIQTTTLFTPEEFLPEAQRLCAAHPRGGRTALECAEMAAKAGALDQSAAFYALSLKESKDKGAKTQRGLRQAEILERAGKIADAVEGYKALAADPALPLWAKQSVDLGLERTGER